MKIKHWHKAGAFLYKKDSFAAVEKSEYQTYYATSKTTNKSTRYLLFKI